MTDNPFETCQVERKPNGQWVVGSNFWEIPCVDEKTANRTCELIQGSYRAGASDMRGRFYELLIGDDDDF